LLILPVAFSKAQDETRSARRTKINSLNIESCGWAAWTNSAAVTAASPVPDLRPGGLIKFRSKRHS